MATDDNSDLHGNTIEFLNKCNDATIKRLIKKLDAGQLREILIDRVVKDENNSIHSGCSPIKKIYCKTIYYRKDKVLSDDAWNNIMEFAVNHKNVPTFTMICKRFRNIFSNPNCFIYRKFAVLINENEIKSPPTPINGLLFNYKLMLTTYGHQQVFVFEAIAANSNPNPFDHSYHSQHKKKCKYFLLNGNNKLFSRKKKPIYNNDSVLLFNQHRVKNLKINIGLTYERMMKYNLHDLVSLDVNIKSNSYYPGHPVHYMTTTALPNLSCLRMSITNIINQKKEISKFSLDSVNEIISRFSTQLRSLYLMADFGAIYDPNKDGSNMRININCPSLSFLNILDYGLWCRLKINLNGITELIRLSLSGCFSPSRVEGVDTIKMRYLEVIKSIDRYKDEWIKCFNDERIDTLYLHHPDVMEQTANLNRKKKVSILMTMAYITDPAPFKLKTVLNKQQYHDIVDTANGPWYYPQKTWTFFN